MIDQVGPLSANKTGQQKSVCRAKTVQLCRPIKSFDFILQHRTCAIIEDKIDQLLHIGQRILLCLTQWVRSSFATYFCLRLKS